MRASCSRCGVGGDIGEDELQQIDQIKSDDDYDMVRLCSTCKSDFEAWFVKFSGQPEYGTAPLGDYFIEDIQGFRGAFAAWLKELQ